MWRILVSLCLFFSACICFAEKTETVTNIESEEKQLAQKRFLPFWGAFKEAVLDSDLDRLAAMTYFPFEVKQTVGEWGLDTLAAAEFKEMLPILLKQDSGDAVETETMVDYFARVKHVDTQSIDPEGIFAGSYIFKFIDKKWYFVRAHINTARP